MDLATLFDNAATAKVLDYMINTNQSHTITEIAECSDVSLPTVRLVLLKLVEMGVMYFDRNVGPAKLYSINNDNGIVALFKQIKNV